MYKRQIIYRPLVCKWGEKMSRNKYPEETVKLILDTAAKLFAEKGYDETSLQDIIDRTNLSKGAIYPVSYTHLIINTVFFSGVPPPLVGVIQNNLF